MKKQIITIISVAVAAVLLFTVHSLFFKDDGIEEVGDPFYTLTADVSDALAGIENEVEITLVGYDSADTDWEMIYRFANAIVAANDEFSLETADKNGDFAGITVVADGGSKDIAFADLFPKLYDGTPYAFDGEKLISNAILSLCGKEEMEISLRALDGYDTDGDIVTSTGAPFVFPSLNRSDIAYLTITNSYGEYSIYQDNGSFYFGSSRAITYDDEMFSLLTTNCRYNVAYGKMEMPEGQTWDSYGLNSEKASTASYSLMTTDDSEGRYFLHTVHIGNLSSSGGYYFARYIGGLFQPSETEGEADKLIHNLTKDVIYLIPVDTVATIALPQTDIMSPQIVNPITNTESLFNIEDIRIDFYNEGISALAKNIEYFDKGSNLAAVDTSAISRVISDKVSAKEYSSYKDGWLKNIDVFAGFTSSDGKATYLKAALAKQPENGNYKVVFGLLRDEANGAYLPAKVTISKSYDGINWHSVENGSVATNQPDGTVAEYEISFTDATVVKYLKIGFDVPQKAQTYVVFDEIRIYADDEDAQPLDAVGGTWKLVAPSDYIAEGKNFSHLDMSNFNDFVQTFAALEGERVVACGFSDNGDAASTLLKKEILAEYGLDNPDKHFSFEYDGVVTNLYVSAPNEEGKYYAYSTFSGEVEGQDILATTDVIVELSTTTAEWLGWSFTEFLDHSLFSIYITDITQIDVTMDGEVYNFYLSLDADGGDIETVTYNETNYDVKSFKYLYQSMLSIYMQDEYIPAEGDEGEEYLRLKIHSETNSPEIVFYRDTATKCHFTVDGQGSYYALVEDVKEVREKLLTFISGEIITK